MKLFIFSMIEPRVYFVVNSVVIIENNLLRHHKFYFCVGVKVVPIDQEWDFCLGVLQLQFFLYDSHSTN